MVLPSIIRKRNIPELEVTVKYYSILNTLFMIGGAIYGQYIAPVATLCRFLESVV